MTKLEKIWTCIDGKFINLTHTEFEILVYLMKNRDIVVCCEQLISKVNKIFKVSLVRIDCI